MKFALPVILFLCSLSAYAQQVTGKVADAATGDLMSGTIVLLMDKSDTTKVNSAYVEEDGTFQFERVTPGSYLFKTLLVGYKITRFEVTITAENKDLGTIKISEDLQIQDIVIAEKITRVEQNGDTTNINANAYVTNPDATAEDLVAKMPGITVQNGEVKVNGETVKKVTVDGEEFFGNDAIVVLRSLPAEIVNKVQVFDRQSDQSQFTGFDDGNAQKSINIVTKPDKNNGQFGKAYAGYGTNDRYSAGLNINSFKGKQRVSVIGIANNINVQNFSAQDLTGMGASSNRVGAPGGGGSGGGGPQGPGGNSNNFLVGQQNGISTTNSIGLNYSDVVSPKLKVTASYFFNNSTNVNNSIINRQYFLSDTTSTLYREDNNSKTQNYNHRLSGRIEYTLDSSNSFIYIPTISYQKRNSYQNLLGVNRYMTDSLLSTTENNNENRSDNYSIGNNVMWRHKFFKKGRTFSANLGSTININQVNTTLYSDNFYTDNPLSTRLIDQQGINNTHSYAYRTNFMYTEPISKTGTLQINYSPSYTKNDANKRVDNYNPSTNQYDSTAIYVSNQLDNYTLTQKGGIGYRYAKGKTNFMIGVDAQHVTLSSTQLFPSTSEIEKQFNNILPSAMLKIKFSDSSNIRLFYRSSTSTPGVNQLQNVIDNSNTLLLSTGNQNLKQEYTNSLFMHYGLTSSKKATGSMLFFGINQTNNYIASSSFIATNDTVIENGVTLNKGSQLRRPVNLDGYWNANSFYTYSFPVAKIKSNINLNTGITYIRTPGSINLVTNISNTYGLNAGLGLSSNISKQVDFNVTYNASYNIVENSIRPQLNNNYFYHLATAKVNIMPYKGLVLSSDLNERLYSGLSSSFNQQFLLWNASIGYKLLKDQSLEVKVSVFDLLNQNRSIARTVTESYIQDSYTTVLTRYFMFTVTYTLKNFKAS